MKKFVEDFFPQLAYASVLVGTAGPAQEVTAQLRDDEGRVLAYLKYAEKGAARRRLRQEHSMLERLPEGIGPEAIRFGALCEGEALLKSSITGELLAATLPPPADLPSLLRSLTVHPPVPLDDHPWIVRARRRGMPGIERLLEPLANRDWPVVIQHGDFVPWNLLRATDGTLRAIDWEYGSPEGLPYLDLVHYVLQTSALIYRMRPRKAAQYAAGYLSGLQEFSLTDAETRALIVLTGYDAYRKSLEDGQRPDSRLQRWRRSLWENPSWNV